LLQSYENETYFSTHVPNNYSTIPAAHAAFLFISFDVHAGCTEFHSERRGVQRWDEGMCTYHRHSPQSFGQFANPL
jgi:hypothetical protein